MRKYDVVNDNMRKALPSEERVIPNGARLYKVRELVVNNVLKGYEQTAQTSARAVVTQEREQRSTHHLAMFFEAVGAGFNLYRVKTSATKDEEFAARLILNTRARAGD